MISIFLSPLVFLILIISVIIMIRAGTKTYYYRKAIDLYKKCEYEKSDYYGNLADNYKIFWII